MEDVEDGKVRDCSAEDVVLHQCDEMMIGCEREDNGQRGMILICRVIVL